MQFSRQAGIRLIVVAKYFVTCYMCVQPIGKLVTLELRKMSFLRKDAKKYQKCSQNSFLAVEVLLISDMPLPFQNYFFMDAHPTFSSAKYRKYRRQYCKFSDFDFARPPPLLSRHPKPSKKLSEQYDDREDYDRWGARKSLLLYK